MASALAIATRWRCPPESWSGPPLSEIGSETDEVEQLGNATAVLPGCAPVEQHQRLGDDLVDRHQWVERVSRVLEDHLHPPPLLRGETPAARLERTSVEGDLAAGPLGEAEEQPRNRRLARARLTDEPERFAAPDLEADALDRAQPSLARAVTAASAIVLGEVADDEQLLADERLAEGDFLLGQHAGGRPATRRRNGRRPVPRGHR